MHYIKLSVDKLLSYQFTKELKEDFINSKSQLKQKQLKKQYIQYHNLFTCEELLILYKQPTYCLKSLRHRFNIISGQTENLLYWKLIANVQYNIYHHPTYYQDLLKCEYPNYFNDSILKDVDRTCPQSSEIYPKLIHVLTAYSRRNPIVGYCQGFNFVCYFFLNRFDEEESFWFLCYLLEEILPPNYYVQLQGVLVDDNILKMYIELLMPNLKQHLDKLFVETSIFSIQWLVCCFTMNMLIDELIMHYIITHGQVALIQVSLTLLSLLTSDILQCEDISEVVQVLDNFQHSFNDIQLFSKTYESFYINKRLLEYARIDAIIKLNEKQPILQLRQKQQKHMLWKFDSLNQYNCNEQFPVCVWKLELNKNDYPTDYFIYRDREFNVIVDYTQKNQISSVLNMQIDILIGRTAHVCETERIQYSQLLNMQKQQFKPNLQQTQNKRNGSPLKEFLLYPIMFLKPSKQHQSQQPVYKELQLYQAPSSQKQLKQRNQKSPLLRIKQIHASKHSQKQQQLQSSISYQFLQLIVRENSQLKSLDKSLCTMSQE